MTFLKECHILKSSSIYSNPCKAATSKVIYKLDNLVNLVKNMSLHKVNAATDIDQQTEGKSRIHLWRSMALSQEETGPSNGSRDTTGLLEIRLGQRQIRLMRMEGMSPLEEEGSLKRVKHAEQHY